MQISSTGTISFLVPSIVMPVLCRLLTDLSAWFLISTQWFFNMILTSYHHDFNMIRIIPTCHNKLFWILYEYFQHLFSQYCHYYPWVLSVLLYAVCNGRVRLTKPFCTRREWGIDTWDSQQTLTLKHAFLLTCWLFCYVRYSYRMLFLGPWGWVGIKLDLLEALHVCSTFS